jgi:hypothetical protein
MSTELVVSRDKEMSDRTLGSLHYNGKRVCWTLEDKVRPAGVKVPKATAIPAGRYRLSINWSNKFQRKMVLVENVPNFSGIRLHGGNGPEHTDGCILVAKNRDSVAGSIQGSQEKQVFDIVEKIIMAGGAPFLNIVNAGGGTGSGGGAVLVSLALLLLS